jgi:hypothetical protein
MDVRDVVGGYARDCTGDFPARKLKKKLFGSTYTKK